MFFGHLGNNIFLKLVDWIVNNMKRFNIKKEHNQHGSLFEVLS